MPEEEIYRYDVAVSFAGEDRAFVEAVVSEVKSAGFVVFYDEDNGVEMWGEELTEYFADVYEKRSRFAVVFSSRSYADKEWTRLERRSILVRAMNQASPYLLPVRLDSTPLPGVRPTVGFLDGVRYQAAGVADAIKKKLGHPDATGSMRFNGRVPRSQAESAILLGERPPGWEYLLWSYLLLKKLDEDSSKYNDFAIGFALPGAYVGDSKLVDTVNGELARLRSITRNLEQLLSPEAQERAFGAPGQAGNPELIEHFSSRLASIHEELVSWATSLRGRSTQSNEATEVFVSLAQYAMQPVEAIRTFARSLRDEMDTFSTRLQAGEDIKITRTIAFEIPSVASKRFDRAIRSFRKRHG